MHRSKANTEETTLWAESDSYRPATGEHMSMIILTAWTKEPISGKGDDDIGSDITAPPVEGVPL